MSRPLCLPSGRDQRGCRVADRAATSLTGGVAIAGPPEGAVESTASDVAQVAAGSARRSTTCPGARSRRGPASRRMPPLLWCEPRPVHDHDAPAGDQFLVPARDTAHFGHGHDSAGETRDSPLLANALACCSPAGSVGSTTPVTAITTTATSLTTLLIVTSSSSSACLICRGGGAGTRIRRAVQLTVHT